jgi:hypothetical protein
VLRAPASPPPRTPRGSFSGSSGRLFSSASTCTHGLCGRRLCGAAQRYPLRLWTATSAPLRSSSAIASNPPLAAAQCKGVSLHDRRAGTRPPHPPTPKRKGLTPRGSGRGRRLCGRSVFGRFGDCLRSPPSAVR